MRNLICRCDLNAVQAIAASAFVALAIFAWTERTDVVVADPDGLSFLLLALEVVANRSAADGLRWSVVAVVEHPPRPLGPQSCPGHPGGGGFRQRIHWVVRRILGRGVAHRQPTVHRLVQRSRSSPVALRMRGWQGGSGNLGRPRRRRLRQRLLRQQRNFVADIGPGTDAHRNSLGRRRRPRQRGRAGLGHRFRATMLLDHRIQRRCF